MYSKKQVENFAVRKASTLSVALSLALVSMSVHAVATSNDTWVGTKTQAFLPHVIAKQKILAASANVVTPAESAVPLAQGEPVHVTVSLNLHNEAMLDQFLKDQHTPGTASYGKFLTPAQFAEKYAPTEKDVATVVAHLRKSGFINIVVSDNRQLISADGTAATVQNGFHTGLKSFQHNGRKVFANTDAAQVPSALGGIVNAVLGLQSVEIAHKYSSLLPNAKAGVTPQATATPNASPIEATPAPMQLSAIYNAGSTPTAANTTVAIIVVGSVVPTLADLNTFTTNNQLASVNTNVVQTGPVGSNYSDTSGQDEWSLDSQAIVGSAGGAVKQMIFYASPDFSYNGLTAAFNKAVTDNQAKVINVSIGGCESGANVSGIMAATDQVFKQAIAQGQTFSIAAGDAGAYNCQTSYVSGSPGVAANPAAYDVSWPANSSSAIAVGGTTLYTSAGAYSSETVWNDGLSTIGSYGTQGGYDYTQRLWATGGGFSSYEPAPAWQAGVIGNSATRGLPDIAFDAARFSITMNGQSVALRGTSIAAPIFAGIWARLQSANNNGLGFPAASFYKYFKLSTNSSLLHDVTSGNNGVSGYGRQAAIGWDATTGFGSLNIANLNTFIKNTSDFAR
ncbi:Xanthomonapepsin precursor [Collimonas arenae]|uniref:Xanthomonapepsin n=1 Tax=Collimonas arenae TaxID=279058 RepID=A0A0A1FCY2_9BURK|nr:S53 family peptidase [Collimonas arenae]AIY41640.1 Xanthomonapepsin precursor [Collimonas arenae]